MVEAGKQALDDWMIDSYTASVDRLNGNTANSKTATQEIKTDLKGEDLVLFTKGMEVYHRDGFCNTCHNCIRYRRSL